MLSPARRNMNVSSLEKEASDQSMMFRELSSQIRIINNNISMLLDNQKELLQKLR